MIRYFVIPPLKDGYSISFPQQALVSSVDGNSDLRRFDVELTSVKITVKWNVNQYGFNYIKAFYRTATKGGSLPFAIDLFMKYSSVSEEFIAHFIPGTLKLESNSGLNFIVSATLDVKQKPAPIPDPKPFSNVEV